MTLPFAALHESPVVKGFGCKQLEGRCRLSGGRRPKRSLLWGLRATTLYSVDPHADRTILGGIR